MVRWFLLGAISAVAVTAVGGMAYLRHAGGFSTREQPGAVERWMAREARAAALPPDAKAQKNPVVSNPEVLAEARAHWADHCAGCHANNGSGEIEMGKHLYPPPPDMRLPDTQQLSDGELFYIIKNGIRLTGMPAWGDTSDDDLGSWKLVHFVRHLPQMTFEEQKQMEKLNPKSADERAEEDEVEKFLKGEQISETQHHHH